MDNKEKLIEAQCKKISDLADFEHMIGDLYEIYATLFPDMETFWQSLAKEERKHSKLLIAMLRLLRDGHIFYNLHVMDTKLIEQYVSDIKAKINIARQDGLNPADAIATALSIEASIVEANFYKEVKSAAPEFQTLAHHLIKDTQHHIELIVEQLKKNSSAT